MSTFETWVWLIAAVAGFMLIPACKVFAHDYEPKPIRLVEWVLARIRRLRGDN